MYDDCIKIHIDRVEASQAAKKAKGAPSHAAKTLKSQRDLLFDEEDSAEGQSQTYVDKA